VPVFDGSFEEIDSLPHRRGVEPGALDCNIKRHDLLSYLLNQGCVLMGEGASQSWWANPAKGRRCAVPHLTDLAFLGIDSHLAGKICRDLEIDELVDSIITPFR
jgi:hypothetical protein